MHRLTLLLQVLLHVVPLIPEPSVRVSEAPSLGLGPWQGAALDLGWGQQGMCLGCTNTRSAAAAAAALRAFLLPLLSLPPSSPMHQARVAPCTSWCQHIQGRVISLVTTLEGRKEKGLGENPSGSWPAAALSSQQEKEEGDIGFP